MRLTVPSFVHCTPPNFERSNFCKEKGPAVLFSAAENVCEIIFNVSGDQFDSDSCG